VFIGNEWALFTKLAIEKVRAKKELLSPRKELSPQDTNARQSRLTQVMSQGAHQLLTKVRKEGWAVCAETNS